MEGNLKNILDTFSCATMETSQSGCVYASAENGELKMVDALVGKKFNSIESGENGIMVSTNEGYYLIGTEGTECQTQLEFKNVSGGDKFSVGVHTSGSLYSWGVGGQGQLGQGAARMFCAEPAPVRYNTNFSRVSSGQSFSVATDSNGLMYSFGENFSRQLGLYTKEKSKMHLANAVIEDMSFVPRLIPFSQKHSILKVCCGNQFAMAITKEGKLYSWGAGECGQLGTGRCTHREVPVPVAASSIEGVQFKDIACGSGHVLALSREGSMYAWGLNKSGQLGLGDTSTRLEPTAADREMFVSHPDQLGEVYGDMTTATVAVPLVRVFALTHCSAAVDLHGRLYTWGSELVKNRLLHSDVHSRAETALDQKLAEFSNEMKTTASLSSLEKMDMEDSDYMARKAKTKPTMPTLAPTQVHSAILKACPVESFALSGSCSAALILTRISSVWPKKGPKRTFGNINIYGYGFWPSTQIVVKFSSKIVSLYNPPRACTGRLTGDGVISCKPPKFAETGEYVMTLSMDGMNFLPQQIDITIYKEVTVGQLEPELMDLRATGGDQRQSLSLNVMGAPPADEIPEDGYAVKLQFFRVANNPGDVSARLQRNLQPYYEITTRGMPDTQEDAHSLSGSEGGGPETSRGGTPGQGASRPTTSQSKRTDGGEPIGRIMRLTCGNIDLTELNDINSSQEGGRCLFELRCQVSMNDQDFCPTSGLITGPVAAREQAADDASTSANNGSVITVHSFTPGHAAPSSIALLQLVGQDIPDIKSPRTTNSSRRTTKESNRAPVETVVVNVSGESFLPAGRLPPNSSLQVILTPCSTDGQIGEGSVTVPAVCDSFTNLRFDLNAGHLAELHELYTTSLGASGIPDCCQFTISFQIVKVVLSLDANIDTGDAQTLQHVGSTDSIDDEGSAGLLKQSTTAEVIIPLGSSSSVLPMYVYDDKPIRVLPNSLPKVSIPPNSAGSVEESSDHASGEPTPMAAKAGSSSRPGSPAPGTQQNSRSGAASPVPSMAPVDPSRGSKVSITSTTGDGIDSGFPFYSDAVAVTLHFPEGTLEPVVLRASDPEAGVGMSPLSGFEEDGSADTELRVKGFKVDFMLRPLWYYFQQAGKSDEEIQEGLNMSNLIRVSVSLNGSSQAPESCWAKVFFYGNLVTNMVQSPHPAPKGGFPPGSTVVLTLDSYVPPRATGLCVVRLRGNKDTSFGFGAVMGETVNEEGATVTTVTLETPEAAKVALLEPIVQGKEKLYYIDVSVDGGNTFDESATPTLWLK